VAADITSGKLMPGVRFEFWLQMLGRNRCLAVRDLRDVLDMRLADEEMVYRLGAIIIRTVPVGPTTCRPSAPG